MPKTTPAPGFASQKWHEALVLLKEFHREHDRLKDPALKLAGLQKMAQVVLFKRTVSLHDALPIYRKRFNKRYLNMWGDPCYVCQVPAYHRHHIITLKNGGRNTKRNRIPLCKKCHVKVHPWMQVSPTSYSIPSNS